MDEVGSQIRHWRTKQDPPLSQNALAKLVGVSQASVSDWERKQKNPAERHVRRMVKLNILPLRVLRVLENEA